MKTTKNAPAQEVTTIDQLFNTREGAKLLRKIQADCLKNMTFKGRGRTKMHVEDAIQDALADLWTKPEGYKPDGGASIATYFRMRALHFLTCGKDYNYKKEKDLTFASIDFTQKDESGNELNPVLAALSETISDFGQGSAPSYDKSDLDDVRYGEHYEDKEARLVGVEKRKQLKNTLPVREQQMVEALEEGYKFKEINELFSLEDGNRRTIFSRLVDKVEKKRK